MPAFWNWSNCKERKQSIILKKKLSEHNESYLSLYECVERTEFHLTITTILPRCTGAFRPPRGTRAAPVGWRRGRRSLPDCGVFHSASHRRPAPLLQSLCGRGWCSLIKNKLVPLTFLLIWSKRLKVWEAKRNKKWNVPDWNRYYAICGSHKWRKMLSGNIHISNMLVWYFFATWDGSGGRPWQSFPADGGNLSRWTCCLWRRPAPGRTPQTRRPLMWWCGGAERAGLPAAVSGSAHQLKAAKVRPAWAAQPGFCERGLQRGKCWAEMFVF